MIIPPKITLPTRKPTREPTKTPETPLPQTPVPAMRGTSLPLTVPSPIIASHVLRRDRMALLVIILVFCLLVLIAIGGMVWYGLIGINAALTFAAHGSLSGTTLLTVILNLASVVIALALWGYAAYLLWHEQPMKEEEE